jgi:hypothetical protein
LYSGAKIWHETTLSLLEVKEELIVQLALDRRGGDLVVTGSSDSTAKLWSAEGGA